MQRQKKMTGRDWYDEHGTPGPLPQPHHDDNGGVVDDGEGGGDSSGGDNGDSNGNGQTPSDIAMQWVAEGDSHWDQKDWECAVVAYQRALEYAPSSRRIRYSLAAAEAMNAWEKRNYTIALSKAYEAINYYADSQFLMAWQSLIEKFSRYFISSKIDDIFKTDQINNCNWFVMATCKEIIGENPFGAVLANQITKDVRSRDWCKRNGWEWLGNDPQAAYDAAAKGKLVIGGASGDDIGDPEHGHVLVVQYSKNLWKGYPYVANASSNRKLRSPYEKMTKYFKSDVLQKVSYAAKEIRHPWH